MSNAHKLSISTCVVTYERPDHIKRLLRSIIAQETLPKEVIIIDDSDNENTRKVVNNFKSDIVCADCNLIYQHRPDGSGMTEARNVAIERSTGDIIVFFDDDVEIPPGWFKRLRSHWKKYPDSGVIGGPALSVDKDGEYSSELIRSDEKLNYINEYGETQSRAYRWLPDKVVEVDQVGGANMSFRRNTLKEVSGFNPIYLGSAAYEDYDIMARLRRRGKTILCCPELKVKHYDTPYTGTAEEGSETAYWAGYNGILFRFICFPETFVMSLVRLWLLGGDTMPVWKQIGWAMLHRDVSPLYRIKGYVYGLLYLMLHRKYLEPVDAGNVKNLTTNVQ